MKRRLFLAFPLALAISRGARAEASTPGLIDLDRPWAKPTVTGNAAMFVTLTNRGSRPDRLVGGTTPIAKSILLRAADGTPLEYLDLLPKRPLALRPGRRYIALRDLEQPLAIDDTFPLTLHFARAGSLSMTVVVEEGPEQ